MKPGLRIQISRGEVMGRLGRREDARRLAERQPTCDRRWQASNPMPTFTTCGRTTIGPAPCVNWTRRRSYPVVAPVAKTFIEVCLGRVREVENR
jgi:hypothetical protein